MAVTRTILPRKGLVQPQHGLIGYEVDQDANWALLDSNVAFTSDLQFADLGINGLVNGFSLSNGSGLTPAVTPGVLYAQGRRYAPVSAPVLAPAPANTASYVFYNSTSGMYYQAGSIGAMAGDALIGNVVTSTTGVTQTKGATPIFGFVNVIAPGVGNFATPHLLGRKPLGLSVLMTSGGSLWFQTPVAFDGMSLYLASSAGGVTAAIQVW